MGDVVRGWGGEGGCFGAAGDLTYSQKKSWGSESGTWRRRRQTLEPVLCSQTLEPMFPDSDHGIPDNCVHDLVSPDAIRCSNAHQLVCDFWVSHRILYCFIGLQRHTPVDSRTRGIPHRSPEVSDGSSVSPMVNDDDHCDSLSLRL